MGLLVEKVVLVTLGNYCLNKCFLLMCLYYCCGICFKCSQMAAKGSAFILMKPLADAPRHIVKEGRHVRF